MKLRIATRKGLFLYEKAADAWKVTRTAFLGDPVSLALTDPRNGDQYAALNLGHFGVKLRRADPGTNDWKEVSVPKYPKTGEGEAASLKQIWALSTANADRPGTLWAGTIPGGLFKSEDRGDSWTLVTSLWDKEERAQWVGGGYDEPGIHSVLVHPENSDHLTVAISLGGVWESQNGGESWCLIGEGLRAEYLPPELALKPNLQDPHLLVRCPSAPDNMWIQHHNGIFRSNNGGVNWQEVEAQPSSFGFAVAVHPHQPDTAWFIPGIKDECRIPVDGKLVVTRTSDGGKSFEILRNGLPQSHAYDIVYRHALAVDAAGSTLAFGTTTGNLWISEDKGDHWSLLNSNLPPINAVSFDPETAK